MLGLRCSPKRPAALVTTSILWTSKFWIRIQNNCHAPLIESCEIAIAHTFLFSRSFLGGVICFQASRKAGDIAFPNRLGRLALLAHFKRSSQVNSSSAPSESDTCAWYVLTSDSSFTATFSGIRVAGDTWQAAFAGALGSYSKVKDGEILDA